ncbi:ATP-grasp domain-containing protein [Streptomyces sp. NPDC054956]
MSLRPFVLVVAPGDDIYRGYCLRQVADAYDVAVITTGPITWEGPHVVDHEIVSDIEDEAGLFAAGEALAERRPIAGVVTWAEGHLTAVARLAEHLGLATTSVESVRTCRDKAASRAAFAAHGVPSARSTAANSLDEALSAASAIGYPVVVKPASVGGSIGVIKAETQEDLADAYAFATRGVQLHGGDNTVVLVEEYLSGEEVSVECVTYQGVTTAVTPPASACSPPTPTPWNSPSRAALSPRTTSPSPSRTAGPSERAREAAGTRPGHPPVSGRRR